MYWMFIFIVSVFTSAAFGVDQTFDANELILRAKPAPRVRVESEAEVFARSEREFQERGGQTEASESTTCQLVGALRRDFSGAYYQARKNAKGRYVHGDPVLIAPNGGVYCIGSKGNSFKCYELADSSFIAEVGLWDFSPCARSPKIPQW